MWLVDTCFSLFRVYETSSGHLIWSRRGRSYQASGCWRVSHPSLTLWPSCPASSNAPNRRARWKQVVRVWRPTSCSSQSTPQMTSFLTLSSSCPQPSPVALPSSGECSPARRALHRMLHWLVLLACSRRLWTQSSVPKGPLWVTRMAYTYCGSLFLPAGRRSFQTPLPTPPTFSCPSSPRRLRPQMITGASSHCGSPHRVSRRLVLWTRGRR